MNSIINNEAWPNGGVGAKELISEFVQNVLIDISLINSNGFYHFYNAWLAGGALNRKKIYFQAVPGDDEALAGKLVGTDIIHCIDYAGFGSALKEGGRSWIFITNSEERAESVRESAIKAGSRIRIYGMDDKGLLKNYRPIVNRRHDTRPRNYGSENRIGSFRLSKEMVQIQKKSYSGVAVPIKGKAVYDSKGHTILLGDEFISNQQSITYQTNLDGFQAKIYQKEWLFLSYHEDKLNRMLEIPMDKEGICWPVDKLYNERKEFVGALIPAAEGYQLKQDVMSQAGIEAHFPQWDRWSLTHVARVILEKIVYLQERNVIFGIINPSAIFVKDVNHVFFTEMDSLQIEGFPILSFEGVMQPPELQGAGQEIRLYTKEQDDYEIALLTFMLLMPGKFPYNKGKNKTISDSIKSMSFAFRYGGKKNVEHGAREYYGLWRFVWSHLGDELKSAFYNTFQGGQRFSEPSDRRDARFWLKKIARLEDELIDPYDKESLKIFPRTFKRYSGTQTIKCNKCGIEHPTFYYLYPEKRICNSCLGKPSTTFFVCKSCNMEYYYDYSTLFKYEKLVESKGFKMPTHCPYCRSDKERCKGECGKMQPTYRLDRNGMCPECSKKMRNRIVKRYYCSDCGTVVELSQGEVEFYQKKGWDIPNRCEKCRSKRRKRY